MAAADSSAPKESVGSTGTDEEFGALKQLIDLAKLPSSEGRRELMNQLTDIFDANSGESSDAERQYFAEISIRILDEARDDLKAEISEKIADANGMPEELLVRLTNDIMEVARPVIERSSGLSEEALVELVKNKTDDYRLAVTKRESISESVSEALVDHGSTEVVSNLIENEGASFHKHTMEQVIDRSETETELQGPLVKRKDVPEDLSGKLYDTVSTDLKGDLLRRDSNLDEKSIEAVVAVSEASTRRAMAKLGSIERKAISKAKVLAASNKLDIEAAITMLRNREFPEFVASFAVLCELEYPVAKHVAMGSDREPLMVVCKAYDFDANVVRTLLALTKNETDPLHDDLVRLYGRLPKDAAQRVLRFMRVRQSVETAE